MNDTAHLKALKRNVPKFYLSSFLGGWAFTAGILIFYYREIGFSYTQIFVVTITYEVLNFLLEIPTGVLADLWSRKWTITLGHAISGASFLVVMLRPEAYWMYLLWAILSAICTTLNSGTATAIVYDSLLAVGEEERFGKIQGRTFAIDLLTQTVTIALGGLLADQYGFRAVLLLSGIGGLLQAAVIATLAEPPIPLEGNEPDISDQPGSIRVRFVRQITSSLSVLFSNLQVRWILIYSILGFIIGQTFGIIFQPYLANLGYTSHLSISIFSAVFALVTAVVSFIVGEVKSAQTEKLFLVLISLGMTLPFLAIGIASMPIGIGALIILCSAIGASQVVVPEIMNRLIPSNKRATILSAQNQLGSISYSIVGAGLGISMDQIGLTSSTFVVGIVSFIAIVILLSYLPRLKEQSVADEAPEKRLAV